MTEKPSYTDEDRRRAMAALLQAGRDLVVVFKATLPALKEIGDNLRKTLEDITAEPSKENEK